MIIFLYGKDTYRAKEKLKEIIESYKTNPKGGVNLKYFDEKELDIKEFIDFFNQESIFKGKKLAVIVNPFKNNQFKESFLEKSKIVLNLKDAILCYQEGEVKKIDSLFKFLNKNAKCQEFELLDGQKLKIWVEKEFDKYGGKIEPDALRSLVGRVSNDLWQMSNEIKKLVNFKKNGIVNIKDVALLVKPKIETDIFKTIDAIAQKNKKQALALLRGHLEKGDPPLYLLSMINFQFRNLLMVKDLMEKNKTYNTILEKTKLHPFVIKKSYLQAQKFDFEELKKIYRKISEVDLDIKTGKIDPMTALEILVAEI